MVTCPLWAADPDLLRSGLSWALELMGCTARHRKQCRTQGSTRKEGRTHESLPTSLNLEPTQICAQGLGSVPRDLRCTIRALDLAQSDGSCVFGGQSLRSSVGTPGGGLTSWGAREWSQGLRAVKSFEALEDMSKQDCETCEMDLAGASRCWDLVVSRSVFRKDHSSCPFTQQIVCRSA